MMTDDPNKFAVTDTVRISNIPGPRMIVVSIEPATAHKAAQVQCMWFDRRAELRSRAFEPRFLSKASQWSERDYRSMADILGEGQISQATIEESADAGH